MQKWLSFFPWLQRRTPPEETRIPAPEGAEAAAQPDHAAEEAASLQPLLPEPPPAPPPDLLPPQMEAATRNAVAAARIGAEASALAEHRGGVPREGAGETEAPKPAFVPLTVPYPAALVRPPHRAATLPDRELLIQSQQLAHMTYTLAIEPWLLAGWRDFSFQIDDTLESGASRIRTDQDADFLRLANLSRMRRARHALNAANPLVRIMAALRQREKSDTVKAVCMMHPLPGEKHLLAIGFMGTGKRFYDWFSNFRMGQEDGFHQGFSQLCDHFEQMAEEILFPETALALGLEKLSLRDVLWEMQSPGSRFRLWMAGHSQGGAVMQIYTHRLMTCYGVRPEHLCGISFAAPTVAWAKAVAVPGRYPLWHVRNREDVICRVGAQVHLGHLLDFCPDAAFRARSYQYSSLPADEAARAWIRPVLDGMQDHPSALLYLTALLLSVGQEKGEDAMAAIARRYGHLLGWLLPAAGERAQGLLTALAERQKRAYLAQTGQEMDPARLDALVQQLRPCVAATPLRRILSALAACLLQPHQLADEQPHAPGAYSLIVREHTRQLIPCRWENRLGQPVRRRLPTGGRRQRPCRGKARLMPARRR